MIDVIVLTVTGLWICVSAVLDRRRFRKCPGRLIRLFSLLLMAALMVECCFLYGTAAVTKFPDILCLSTMMLLSFPLTFEPEKRSWGRMVVAAVLSLVALAIPALPETGYLLSHPVTLFVAAAYLLAVSLIALTKWIHSQDAGRTVAPLRMAEQRIRSLDILSLLLIAGGTSLVAAWDTRPVLLWIPGVAGTAFYGVLYYRAGSCSSLSSQRWLRGVSLLRTELPPPLSKEPLDDEFYKSVYRKCCHYMESKKPFLVESFSLGDLSAGVFTNKSYVSKAINQSSSLNFRRFVNRYRVAYAQEIFKQNMALRVQDLTMLSGCHSIQTFCAVFKLFTGETPRDWCARMRKERQ